MLEMSSATNQSSQQVNRLDNGDEQNRRQIDIHINSQWMHSISIG